MDIRKWLAETVQPNLSLNLVQQSSIEASLRPRKSKPVIDTSRRLDPSKSDSSLLDPRPQQEEISTNERSRVPKRDPYHKTKSNVSQATQSESSQSDTSSQQYTRKPRRKTRPERYQPSSKVIQERGKLIHQSRKGESKKMRRKSKRKKREKPGTDMMQNFHAKNVSGDRLTVRAATYAAA